VLERRGHGSTGSARAVPHHPSSTEDAARVQADLAAGVRVLGAPVPPPRTVAGLDVSYEAGSDRGVAAAVLVDVADGRIVEEVLAEGTVTFPYVPGLLAFRELPLLLRALDRLTTAPDLLLCDGQGIAHPHRCGLASHLGVVTGLAAVGCAKNHLVGRYTEPGPHRGDRAALVADTTVLGHALRTQDGVRPVYVSPGHGIGPDQATDLVLALSPSYRLPDPLRRADHLSRQALTGRGTGMPRE
jgi:deoxyribonuclease V